MDAQLARRLLDHIHRHRQEMIALTEQLAMAESPSSVPQSQQQVMALLDAALRARGFRNRRIAGRTTGGTLLAIDEQRCRHQPIQLLLGHCDTVWPVGTLEHMPVRQQGSRLHGPGVYDMKAGLVQAIFALDALRATGATPAVSPVWLINSDEEIGSPESSVYIRRVAQLADRVLVLEPSLGPSGCIKTQRKGVGRFTIRAIGKAAHAGLDPEKGASAILELSLIIQKLFALNDPARGVTVNVGTIDGGLRPNVVAPESRAVVDVRALTQVDAAQLERDIRALQAETPGTQLVVEGRFGRPPLEKTPGNERLWQLAQRNAAQLGIELAQATAGGGSDGNTTSAYAPTLDGLGAVGGGAHAAGEFIEVEPMVERSALVAALLLEDALQTGSPAR